MSLSGKKNEKSEISESKNLKSTSLNLSEVNVNKTFKNILRNGDATVRIDTNFTYFSKNLESL